jgi:hypothetical protein
LKGEGDWLDLEQGEPEQGCLKLKSYISRLDPIVDNLSIVWTICIKPFP